MGSPTAIPTASMACGRGSTCITTIRSGESAPRHVARTERGEIRERRCQRQDYSRISRSLSSGRTWWLNAGARYALDSIDLPPDPERFLGGPVGDREQHRLTLRGVRIVLP